jgi:hypothetical protein
LAVGDLDVEAVHLVELHLEVGDAGALPLAGFELEQEGAAVVWIARSSSRSAL